MGSKLPILIRRAGPDDMGLVHSSWLKSFYRHGPRELRLVPSSLYYKCQDERIANILKKTVVEVACNPDHRDQVYGWICFAEPVVHYVFVRKMWRDMGVATDLIIQALPGYTEGIRMFTHYTVLGARMAYRNRIIYNPYEVDE